MFNECVKQLDSFKPNMFRLESHQKAWKCQFANENAQDLFKDLFGDTK